MQQLIGLDASFLAFETVNSTGHVGGVCVLDPGQAPAPLALARLTEVLAERLPLVPVLRQKLLNSPLGLDQPYWVEAALRIPTGARSTVQRGMARALEKLIDLERSRGAFEAALDPPALVYAIVRISESFLYADVIADGPPDIGRAITVIDALLFGLDLVHRTPVSAGRQPG